MKNAIVLSEKSLQQIEKSADWFFQQKPVLEIKFLNELNKEFEFIQNIL